MAEAFSAEVCIAGAGPVGGILACRLARAGIKVALIDRASMPLMELPTFDGRAYAIAAGSRVHLEEAGLWDAFNVRPNPISGIRVSDGRCGRTPSRRHLHFEQVRAVGDTGPFGWMVEARTLRKALNAGFGLEPNLRLFAPAQAVIERSESGCSVRLDSGLEIGCRLVVGAEGRDSQLRDQARIPVTRINYHQTAIVCAVVHDRPHHDIALEHFLPAGPFAALPLGPSPDAESETVSHVSGIVWTEGSERAKALMALGDARFAREVGRRLGSHLGGVRMVGRRWSYPLSALVAHRYVDRRLALAGDAVHGIHPIAGQGLNLGLRDGMVLFDLITEAAMSGRDIGGTDVLLRYQRMRRPDSLSMFAATDALDRLFSTDNRMTRIIRDIGISGVDRTRPIKQAFTKHAMGLA